MNTPDTITDVSQHISPDVKSVVTSHPNETISETQVKQESSITQYADDEVHTEVMREAPLRNQLTAAVPNLSIDDLGSILSRSYQVAIIDWSSSDAQFSRLIQFNPIILLYQIEQIGNRMDYYRYLTFDYVNVQIKIQATKWHYGSLCLNSLYENRLISDENNPDAPQFMQNNPVLCDASKADAVDYKMPFIFPEPYLRKTDWADSLNRRCLFNIHVGVPLRTVGDAETDARVSVFANFVNPQMSFPVAQSSIEEETKASADSILATISDVTSSFVKFADTANELAPLLSLLALDKPGNVQPAKYVMPQPYSDFALTSGTDYSFKTTLDPEAKVATEDEAGNGPSNPSLQSLVCTPGFIGNFAFDTNTTASSLLYSNGLNPLQFTYAAGVGNTVLTPTYLSWFSQPFTHWRGSLRVRVHFVTSEFVTARLRMVFFPPDIGPPSSIDDSKSGDYLSQVFDVTGTTIKDFEFQYTGFTPWKYTKIPSVDTSAAMRPGVRSDSTSIGFMALYLVTSVVSFSSTVTPVVSALVYGAAAPDFQLASMNEVFSSQATERVTISDVTQSAVFAEFSEAEFTSLGATRPYTKLAGVCQSDEGSDIVSLMKRYHPRGSVEMTAVDQVYDIQWDAPYMVGDEISGADSTQQVRETNLISWLSAPFTYLKGSRRYKLIIDFGGLANLRDAIGELIPYATRRSTLSQASSPYLPINSANAGYVQWELAYYDNNSYVVQQPMPVAPRSSRANTFSRFRNKDATTNYTLRVLESVGDDFGVYFLQSPPFLFFNNAPPPEELLKEKDSVIALRNFKA